MRAFLSLIILNVVGTAGCVYAWKLGYAAPLFAEGVIPFVILGLLAVGITVLWRGWRLSQVVPFTKLHAEKEIAKISHLHDVSDWLVGLGLIGTTIGLISAGITADNAATAVSTALPAALLGLIGWLWIGVNYRILDTAANLHMIDVDYS